LRRRNAWARTSVDLLVEHLHKLAERFAPCQRPRLEDAMRFVRDQRRIRKLVRALAALPPAGVLSLRAGARAVPAIC
jgi:hypothetical protein